jgi:hypothetical protein
MFRLLVLFGPSRLYELGRPKQSNFLPIRHIRFLSWGRSIALTVGGKDADTLAAPCTARSH